MFQQINSGGRYSGRRFFSRMITANALLEGKNVLIASIDKESALNEIKHIKDDFKLDNLKFEHQYRKDTVFIYQNELTWNPIVGVKTTRKYTGTLCFLQ